MNLTFAWPWYLLAAALTPGVVWLVHGLLEARARRQLRQVAAAPLWADMLASVSYGRRWLRASLLALAVAAICLALARPQAGSTTLVVEQPKLDFIIGLDVSRSMLAEDMEGLSRLEVAKAGLSALLHTARGGQAGLIAFAGEAFISAPLTSDFAVIERQLEALAPHLISRQGTDLAQAIALAQRAFAKSNTSLDPAPKVLLLVTDGEELQGAAKQAAQEAVKDGIHLFTVGVGTPGGALVPVRDPNQPSHLRYAQNEFQREVISRLNEPMLRQLAASGGGHYLRLDPEGKNLAPFWKETVLPLAHSTTTSTWEVTLEYFQWPLAFALALLLGERLIPDRKSRSSSR